MHHGILNYYLVLFLSNQVIKNDSPFCLEFIMSDWHDFNKWIKIFQFFFIFNRIPFVPPFPLALYLSVLTIIQVLKEIWIVWNKNTNSNGLRISLLPSVLPLLGILRAYYLAGVPTYTILVTLFSTILIDNCATVLPESER